MQEANSSDYNSFASAQVSSSTTNLGLTGAITITGSFGSSAITYTGNTLAEIASEINADGTLSTAGITASV
ncbi:MAG: hypothetical protein VW709_17760, partial [Rickettsiales bacterium]